MPPPPAPGEEISNRQIEGTQEEREMERGHALRPKVEHVDGGIEVPPPMPRPLEALQGTPIPPFLSKTYDIVDDAPLDPIISWGPTGESFVVWDPMEFSRTVLPRHFKHNNFSSFVRQLNTYGFRKIGTDRWEFANEDFQRGKRALLKYINRRRSSQAHQICTQIGSSGEMGKAVVETEVQKLKRERDLLMQEVMELRKDQLMTVEKMDSLNHRMQAAELRQKQMVSFLAKVLQNPAFIGHLKQLKGQREDASMRGKRKFIKHHQHQPIFSASAKPMNQQLVKYTESSESSDALLHVCEHGEGNRIPEHLLKDIADKLDLDTDGEVIGQSDESAGLEEKNILNPQMDSEFPGSDYLISLPEDIANLETEYIPQEAMFPDAMAHSDACVSAGVWNIGVDVGGSMLSSEPAVWDDSLGHYNDAREMEAAAGSCSLWDLGLNALEEDLDIGNFMGGESSLQEHKDDAGQPNADCSKDLEP